MSTSDHTAARPATWVTVRTNAKDIDLTCVCGVRIDGVIYLATYRDFRGTVFFGCDETCAKLASVTSASHLVSTMK